MKPQNGSPENIKRIKKFLFWCGGGGYIVRRGLCNFKVNVKIA